MADKPVDSTKTGAPVSNRALRHIQKQIEQKEAERKQEMFRQRLAVARKGVQLFSEGKLPEALKSFYAYIRILEDAKGVPDGGLTPANFEAQRDLPEIMIISGIYWDMAKLHDRMRDAQKERDFHLYLEKYILFTKGFPHQHVAAETLRRHIRHGKPTHKKAFLAAYRRIGKSKCFVVSSLSDHCADHTLPKLREYRDQELMRTPSGKVAVAVYYRVGPCLARIVDCLPEWTRRAMAHLLDQLAARLPGDRT